MTPLTGDEDTKIFNSRARECHYRTVTRRAPLKIPTALPPCQRSLGTRPFPGKCESVREALTSVSRGSVGGGAASDSADWDIREIQLRESRPGRPDPAPRGRGGMGSGAERAGVPGQHPHDRLTSPSLRRDSSGRELRRRLGQRRTGRVVSRNLRPALCGVRDAPRRGVPGQLVYDGSSVQPERLRRRHRELRRRLGELRPGRRPEWNLRSAVLRERRQARRRVPGQLPYARSPEVPFRRRGPVRKLCRRLVQRRTGRVGSRSLRPALFGPRGPARRRVPGEFVHPRGPVLPFGRERSFGGLPRRLGELRPGRRPERNLRSAVLRERKQARRRVPRELVHHGESVLSARGRRWLRELRGRLAEP